MTHTSGTAQEYLDQGVAYKRQGNYAAAKRCYASAMQLAPENLNTYYNLAKTCYLTGERQEAIVNYVRGVHLVCAGASREWRAGRGNTFLPTLETMIPRTLVSELRSINDLATFPLYDPNAVRHVAHAVHDLDPNNRLHSALSSQAEAYRFALAGGPAEFDDEIEGQVYLPWGMLFLARNIRWTELDDQRVTILYPPSQSWTGATTSDGQATSQPPQASSVEAKVEPQVRPLRIGERWWNRIRGR